MRKFQAETRMNTIFIVGLSILAMFFLFVGLFYHTKNKQGKFDEWSEFSPCSKSCGGGLQYRKKICSSSSSFFGWPICNHRGKEYEIQKCSKSPCPVNGGFEKWSAFSTCSKSCGGGMHIRIRYCINPPPMWGGRNCSEIGSYQQKMECNQHPCPINGGYSSWLPWGECSVTCGSGKQTRRRLCNNPLTKHDGLNCSVIGKDEEAKVCSMPGCPVNGGYGEWEKWGNCDVDCGNGKRKRVRHCDSPSPENGGLNCDTEEGSQVEGCSMKPCTTAITNTMMIEMNKTTNEPSVNEKQ